MNGWVASTRPCADLDAVVVQRHVAALRQPAAVVGELHPDLMCALRDRLLGLGRELPDAEQVVDEARRAVLGVERPAPEAPALGDDRAVGRAIGHDDLRGDGERLVLDAEDAGLRQATHAAEQHLRVAADELGPAGDVGVEPLGGPVVEREHVVLRRLHQPEPLELVEPVGHLLREVVGLRPVLRPVVELPDVVVERRHVRAAHHPRGPVLGYRAPALVVDAAVAEHLEVLQVVALRARRARRSCKP